jgi:RNA polymerase sigma-70 factor, ECF subfamily
MVLSHGAKPGPPVSAAAKGSDEELMGLYRGGNQAAFRKLYERYRGPLIRFVRRTAFEPSDVEEVVQETWMAIIRRREQYVPHARFVTYLFSIARRRGIDRWRQRGRLPELDDIDAHDDLSAPERTQPESIAGHEALAPRWRLRSKHCRCCKGRRSC